MSVLDRAHRRVFGAFRFVDAASRQQVQDVVRVASGALDIRRNPSGFYVVFDAPGLHKRTTEFDVDQSTPWPAATPFDVSIRPVGCRYLPRRAAIAMPRTPAPMTDPASAMLPQDVTLYLGPTNVTGVNWAIVRATLTQGTTTAPVPFAVLRLVRDSDSTVLATGMSDGNGEAILGVPGIGVTTSTTGTGAVISTTVDTTLTAFFDPATLDALKADPRWLPNPDDVLKNLANPALKKRSQAVKIGRGTQSYFKLPIAL